MHIELSKFQRAFNRIEAIGGDDIAIDLYKKAINDSKVFIENIRGQSITKNEMGCAMSHINSYKEFLKSNENFALILEDDVNISNNVEQYLINLDTLFKKSNFDIILLGFSQDSYTYYRRVIHFGKKIRANKSCCIYRPVYNLYGAFGYVISRKGAEKLLKINTPIKKLADQATGESRQIGLKTYVSEMPLIWPNLEYTSDIDKFDKRNYNSQQTNSIIKIIDKTLYYIKTTFLIINLNIKYFKDEFCPFNIFNRQK
jgi:GR25 family glycosyltransferase involved in LPS biosynthesis